MGSNINNEKDKQQRMALNAWARLSGRGSIIAGTGFGKSRCGVLACKYILDRIPDSKVLILVPTIQLQGQFAEEFEKWGCSEYLSNIEILCYQSAYKLQGQNYSLVVCDEVHLGLSKQYRKFFKNNKYKHLLAMTATMPEDIEYKLELLKIAPKVYEITLDQCVAMGLVSPYEIYCIPLEFTFGEQLEYDSIQQDFVKHKVWLGPDAFELAKFFISNKQCTSEERSHAIGFYNAMRERKNMVDTASAKIDKFKELVADNLDKRIITFGGLNEFTDKLAESVTPLAEVYHSKRTLKNRREALRRFKEGEVNVLCSTKALNQGFDIPNANVGIICGLTSKSLSMIQRIGRLIRFEEGKVGKIYILYIEDSQEKKWLTNSLRELNGVKWL
jgi:superfamily II DNA or RNA helicase